MECAPARRHPTRDRLHVRASESGLPLRFRAGTEQIPQGAWHQAARRFDRAIVLWGHRPPRRPKTSRLFLRRTPVATRVADQGVHEVYAGPAVVHRAERRPIGRHAHFAAFERIMPIQSGKCQSAPLIGCGDPARSSSCSSSFRFRRSVRSRELARPGDVRRNAAANASVLAYRSAGSRDSARASTSSTSGQLSKRWRAKGSGRDSVTFFSRSSRVGAAPE
jgi:hypothetical protein